MRINRSGILVVVGFLIPVLNMQFPTKSLHLLHRFILLGENYVKISISPPNLNETKVNPSSFECKEKRKYFRLVVNMLGWEEEKAGIQYSMHYLWRCRQRVGVFEATGDSSSNILRPRDYGFIGYCRLPCFAISFQNISFSIFYY